MSDLGHHIRLRLTDGRVIATNTEQRRMVARVVLEKSRTSNLLAMCLVDSHLHLESVCGRSAAGLLAHRIESSLKQRLRLSVSFVQYEPELIRDHRHLHSTFRYVLSQPAHHGLPALELLDGSNAPDLLGLRLLGRYTLRNVRRWLPRVTRDNILAWSGLAAPVPADAPLHHLEEATLAAACLDDLRGSSRAEIEARRAMVAVIGARQSTQQTAAMLKISSRSVRWLRAGEASPALVEAIRNQLGMRAQGRAEAVG